MEDILYFVDEYFHAFAWFLSGISSMPLLWIMVAALAVYAIICLTWSLILDD